MTTTAPTTPAAAAIELVRGIAEIIRTEPDGVIEGTLYAALMAHGCTLAQFESIIGFLLSSGMVERTSSHRLIWKD